MEETSGPGVRGRLCPRGIASKFRSTDLPIRMTEMWKVRNGDIANSSLSHEPEPMLIPRQMGTVLYIHSRM